MSAETDYLKLIQHSAGDEGWADDMNANLNEIDSVLADISKSNIFINPMLRFWQRGTSLTGVSGDKYLADRWINYLGSTRCIVSRQEFTPGQTDVPCEPQYYHSLFSPSGTLTQSGQRLEDVRTCAGQQAVLSFHARADKPQTAATWVAQGFGSGGSTWVLVDNTSYGLTTSWQKYVFQVDIPPINGKTIGASSNLYAGFNRVVATEDVNIDFALPQFNLGSVPLPFKPRPSALEEMLCQRYYETVGGNGVSHELFFSGAASTEYTTNGVWYFKVPKRIAPTISAENLSDLAVYSPLGCLADEGCTSFFVDGLSRHSVQLCTRWSSPYWTPGAFAWIRDSLSGATKFTADAEIY